ncbi:MAG: hypothetical protein M3N47_15150 [Chloroflexota bacterium]|nr:hypothetical protein [Chloroflexota bacterium]
MLTALPPDLRSRLNFTGATADEIAEPIDTLPSRIVERALVGREEDYAKLVEAKSSQSIEVQPPKQCGCLNRGTSAATAQSPRWASSPA